ncbi:HdeD family acid-resistance protein [Burkholderia theae]|uniref:HdeD family acid-resistance protein n=1 Tax=Burkholderia theae TaxID=3143496 RepID=UPI003AFB17CA
MVRLILLLLGIEYLRTRWRGLTVLGWLWVVAGVVIFVDALDGALHFPIELFAWLFLIEGLATLAVAGSGVGGQRILRYVKGIVVVVAAGLVFAGHHHGHFLLSMIFGMLFLVDGLLQCTSAWMVRYRRWNVAFAWGVVEILLAVFFFQPYPTHYVGTVPYCLGLLLIFGGMHMLSLAARVRRLTRNPAFATSPAPALAPDLDDARDRPRFAQSEWDGPPADGEHALTVHVWTPAGTSKAEAQRYPVIDRYIAAVDANGVISTGHAALESPEGIYISLYPGVEIDRSPDEFTRILRATRENDVPGLFQPDYATESNAWCPSTVRVRIRNYDPAKLDAFWSSYRQNVTYNLTYRNCSSTVSNALEAALDGAVWRLKGAGAGWGAFVRLLLTPELWVAAQIRKRAVTMAWTPGLTLDYARALSMLADPRPFAWWKVARSAVKAIMASRRAWREQDSAALSSGGSEAASMK